MTLAILYSRSSNGIHAPSVCVEVHIGAGLPKFSIVGLPDTEVKESRDRVRSTLLNLGFTFPYRRITVNLAPADLPKEGGRFDLPIALGILVASHQLPCKTLDQYEFAGELALTGELRPFHGALAFAVSARNCQRQLIFPLANAKEAALVNDVTVLAATHLSDVCRHLTGQIALPIQQPQTPDDQITAMPDLRDVHGQLHARRALEIAASGGHHLLFVGPPGTGKTMLASRLPSILPILSIDEALATAAILSISHHGIDPNRFYQRPFRAPHHTTSSVALVGGGSPPKPGEISLAHNGVLFLDELPEYPRRVLDTLREPLESGHITISRAARQVQFPAQFQLIGAMNPCPCGYHGDPQRECRCTSDQIQRYQTRLSGPLLDRIDLHVTVPALPHSTLLQASTDNESSQCVRQRTTHARKIQQQRQQCINALLTSSHIQQHCQLNKEDSELLAHAMTKLHLSARAYHRILRVSRTIADLDNATQITRQHLLEALNYRPHQITSMVSL